MRINVVSLNHFGPNKEKDSDFVGGWVQISIPLVVFKIKKLSD